ncbi:TM2D2-like protein [Mya arenaria]|uniref:TM2D2-like protein n=1 Tax=Mya arenaria TaxID=6604 RepID=A0ABY7FN82_MYAAR|nr:TM2D2-like protein [Mya arenaria]
MDYFKRIRKYYPLKDEVINRNLQIRPYESNMRSQYLSHECHFESSIMQYLCYLLGVLTVAFAQELEECFENCTEYRPHAPLVLCSPMEYLACIEPVDLNGNETRRLELDGFGCTKWGGERYEDVQKSKVMCIVLQGITCHGNRTFQKDGFPCIKYSSWKVDDTGRCWDLVDCGCRFAGDRFIETRTGQ